jgi:hypothetical protein
MVALAGGALAAVVVVALLLTVGVGGDPGPDSPRASVTTRFTTTPSIPLPVTTTSQFVQRSRSGDAVGVQDATMYAVTADTFASSPPHVDRLAAESVLRILAIGFEANATGTIEQCTATSCGNRFPVVFDFQGVARLQYLVSASFADADASPTRCRAADPPCAVHLRSQGSSAFLTTVFGDAARPAPRVTLEPNAALQDGAKVRVVATGFTPGEQLEASLCAAPDTFGARRCGPPAPVARLEIDGEGRGETLLTVRTGRVGTERALCGRGTKCVIVVGRPRSRIPAPAVPVAFSAGPGVRYQPARWLMGIAIALVLLTLASLLIRTTDWRKPTEADTPELDRVVLAD